MHLAPTQLSTTVLLLLSQSMNKAAEHLLAQVETACHCGLTDLS